MTSSLSHEKYVIRAVLDAEAKVAKPDIVGAIFGQTEGLLEDMDLRELQETGRIGRIQVQVSGNGESAEIQLPSTMNAERTAVVAATLETVERAGSSPVNIRVEKIEDRRNAKRDYIQERASELLQEMEKGGEKPLDAFDGFGAPGQKLASLEGFEAGPGAESSSELVLVEGRSDLLKLVDAGFENAVALGGTNVPGKIERLDDRDLVAFLDGDRSAERIREELEERLEVEKFLNAPEGREVEELSRDRIRKELENL